VIVPVDDAFALALATLGRGGVAVLPTETVYGLVALAADRAAMERLFILKDRPDTKAISVLVGDIDQARALTEDDLDLCGPWWPGPLTAVVRRRPDAALYLGADATTIGLRCPDHPFVRRLALELGPIDQRESHGRTHAGVGIRDRRPVPRCRARGRRRPTPRATVHGGRPHDVAAHHPALGAHSRVGVRRPRLNPQRR
jgi:hypothetical protein